MLIAILVVEVLGERLATPSASVGVMAFVIIKISNCSGLYLSKKSNRGTHYIEIIARHINCFSYVNRAIIFI